MTACTQILRQLIVGQTEAGDRVEAPEAQNRVGGLVHAAMVLLGEVVQILAAPVEDLPTQDPTDRFAVGGMMVSGDMQLLATEDLDQAP